MSETSGARVAQFRRRNAQFTSVATGAIAVIALMMAMTILVVSLRGNVMRFDTLRQLPLAWTPALFYLWALWSARMMFQTFARDGFVFAAAVRALSRIGWALTLGGATSIAATFVRLAWGTHVVAGFAAFNVPALTLGVVGLALIAMARMMARAGELEAKVAKLDAELQDFV